MRFLVRIIETVTKIFSGHVQAWLTMALMILVMVDVTSRYVMRNPLAIGDEYGGFCLVAITCLGLAYAWKTRSHVRVEFIIKKLPIRKQRWLRLLTLFLAFAFTGFMVYGAFKLVSISLTFGTRSTSWLRTPVAWPQMTIIIGAILIILMVPKSAPLVGMFTLGNLLKESGVTDRLANTAATAFIDILTILLGISVGAFMSAASFLKAETLMIFGLGIASFAASTFFGVILAKFMNLFLKEKINPMIGAAGVSAVPMAARVVQRMGQKENPRNFLLMHATGPNIAGVIGTATAAGIFLGLLA